MKIYLTMIWVDDCTNDEREEEREEILKAFTTYSKAEDFLREFTPDFDGYGFFYQKFFEKNDEIEDGGNFAVCNRWAYKTGEYTLLRHFEELDDVGGEEWLNDYRDPSSVELLIREIDLD